MDLEPRVFKETMKNIEMFEDICNKSVSGEIIKEEKDFIVYFEFRLAESLLKDYGESAVKIAKHILASKDECALIGLEKWLRESYYRYDPIEEFKRTGVKAV